MYCYLISDTPVILWQSPLKKTDLSFNRLCAIKAIKTSQQIVVLDEEYVLVFELLAPLKPPVHVRHMLYVNGFVVVEIPSELKSRQQLAFVDFLKG